MKCQKLQQYINGTVERKTECHVGTVKGKTVWVHNVPSFRRKKHQHEKQKHICSGKFACICPMYCPYVQFVLHADAMGTGKVSSPLNVPKKDENGQRIMEMSYSKRRTMETVNIIKDFGSEHREPKNAMCSCYHVAQ